LIFDQVNGPLYEIRENILDDSQEPKFSRQGHHLMEAWVLRRGVIF
jgi:hypothetical protein